jgi:hypothetical protein
MDFNAKDVEQLKILENLITEQGYNIYSQPFRNCSVNQTKKYVVKWAMINNESNIMLSHEIGHIYFWKIEKCFKFLVEIIAWIIGYIICKKNKISTKNFVSVAKRCLKTYIVSYFKKGKEVNSYNE